MPKSLSETKRDGKIDQGCGREEDEIGLGAAGRLCGLEGKFAVADDGDEGRILGDIEPQIGHARESQGQHGGQDDAPEPQKGRHAIGFCRLDLADRNGLDGAAQDFRRIGAHDEAEDERRPRRSR